jgi:hypothetical protein
VPSVLKLCGRANWYLPRVLRWLPDVRVEGDLAPIRLPRRPETIRPVAPSGPAYGQAPVGE